jgi:hypothetical protein
VLRPTPWDKLEEATLNAALTIIDSADCGSELEALIRYGSSQRACGPSLLRQSERHMNENYISTYAPTPPNPNGPRFRARPGAPDKI